MADPLSISASLVGLASFARNLFDFHKSINSVPEALELRVYVDLLIEVSGYPLMKSQRMPRAVEPSVRLCHERLERLEVLAKDGSGALGKSLDSKKGEKAINEFIRSVKILRDIVME